MLAGRLLQTWKDCLNDGAYERDVDQLPEGFYVAQSIDLYYGLDCPNGDGVEQGHDYKDDPNDDESGLALPSPMPVQRKRRVRYSILVMWQVWKECPSGFFTGLITLIQLPPALEERTLELPGKEVPHVRH